MANLTHSYILDTFTCNIHHYTPTYTTDVWFKVWDMSEAVCCALLSYN
jgi:hypothetical protein